MKKATNPAVTASTSAVSSPATTGLRRTHLAVRSTCPTGRARIGSPRSASRSSSSASASADA